MSKTFFAENLEQLNTVAEQIIKHTSPHKKFAFYGEMGVGKTTLIKALSLQLGVKDLVTSPTFSIVNEYLTSDNKKVFHFDMYRIKNKEEVFDLGFEEYIYNDNYCFIEWPEIITEFIPKNYLEVRISIENKKRVVFLKNIY